MIGSYVSRQKEPLKMMNGGVVPVSFTTFGWLGADSGQWRAGSSQRQRDGSGWTCAARELEAQIKRASKDDDTTLGGKPGEREKGGRRRGESDDGNKTFL